MSKKDIEKLNKEYKEFVYAVSHDLAAPIRHIQHFSQFLIETIENPTEEQEGYISTITGASKKLQETQEALLSFSRLKTDKEQWQTCDANIIVKDITRELEEGNNEANYTVIINALPKIHGDPKLIKIMIKSLLDNAFKFHEPDSIDRKITISSSESKLLTIADNGIGFEPERNEEIFQILRKLNGKQYSGIGFGLAYAQKIAEMHDLKIEVQNPSQGTNISITKTT